MKNKYFYNSLLFRFSAPLLFGVFIYLLVLMFFDSVNSIAENFFSREVLFVVALTYLVFESNRLVIVSLNKIYPVTRELKVRIIIQYLSALILTIFLVSISLYSYFTFVEGFNTISTELITFNSIYLFASVFYNLFFFSLVLLHKKNDAKVIKERKLRDNLEYEMQVFRNQVNPDFLFKALEIIIDELHSDKKTADDLVGKLSKIYRYTLDNKNVEFIPLKNELGSLNVLAEFIKVRYDGSFELAIKTGEPGIDLQLIPGTLALILEYAIEENIISKSLPLRVEVNSDNRMLNVEYFLNQKLNGFNPVQPRLDFLSKAYAFYSDKFKKEMLENGKQRFEIPLLEIEEE